MNAVPTALRVAVIGGGANVEHEVSLASAAAAADALEGRGHDVVRLTVGRDGAWPGGLAGAVDRISSCDAVLPLVHGPRGEDGTLAALCDLAGVPYVGSGVGAGAVAMDKWTTKLVAAALGLGVADGALLTAAGARSLRFTGPVVVKPVAAGSSQGVSLVRTADDLRPALASAFAIDDRALVEEVVSGREIDVAVLGRPDGSRWVSPALEIRTDGLFDFATKYDGTAEFLVPAPLTETDRKALEDAALAMYDALGCGGVARIDFFLTDAGLVLNEVNTAPGFTAHSQVPRMFAADGLAYPDLLELLIRDVVVR